jgi:hypothetical protein
VWTEKDGFHWLILAESIFCEEAGSTIVAIENGTAASHNEA